ncbi:MAG: hypothetical protein NTX38_05730, partial [Methylobacter sp.]|nr:hypothetical protein [Methylobacter sp.]
GSDAGAWECRFRGSSVDLVDSKPVVQICQAIVLEGQGFLSPNTGRLSVLNAFPRWGMGMMRCFGGYCSQAPASIQ